MLGLFSLGPNSGRVKCYHLLPLILILIFSGCASNRISTPSSPSQSLTAADITHFSFKGKIGLRHRNKSQSAFINWQRKGEDFKIELHGPFGKGRTTIEKSGAVTRMSDGEREIQAASAEELFYRATQMRMPVSWFHWWLLGLSAPSAELEAPIYGESRRLQAFQQGGWQVKLLRYTEIDGIALPEKLRVSSPEYSLTLVIKTWQIEQSD